MTFWKIFLVAVLTIDVSFLPSACANGTGTFPFFGSSTRKDLVEEETKNHSTPKTERIAKIKKRIKDEIKTARVARVSIESLKMAQDRGATLDDIKSRINANNLQERKPKEVSKKKETNLADALFPGVSPEEFPRGQTMPITVDTVTSHKTLIPFAYYELPVCGPDDIEQIRFKDRKRKNLGERLMGKSLESLSLYDIKVLENKPCTQLCAKNFDYKTIKRMETLVAREYDVQLSLDGLPAHVKTPNGHNIHGYPLGSKLVNEATDKTSFLLNNHVKLTIEYNERDAAPGFVRIVGFSVKPISIAHDTNNLSNTCGNGPVRTKRETILYLKPDKNNKGRALPVVYSYEVQWEKTDMAWTDRWDTFLLTNVDDSAELYMSVLNSVMIVIFLATCIAIIYNDLRVDPNEEQEDDSGWKMVHGDVFRPPTYPMSLSVLVGSGAQITVAILVTLILSQTNLINPAMKGQALSNIVLIYFFSGTVSGYISARIFKFCGGKNWKLNTVVTAVAFPGTIIGMFMILNIFLAFCGSSNTVDIFTIFCAFGLWIGVASPLVFFGSFIGFKRDPISVPRRTNQIARVVPPQHYTLEGSKCSSLIIGGLPFLCVVIQFNFLMYSIWMNQYYYHMDYLLATAILLGVCAMMASVSMCYLRLAREDHRWWWKAFADAASCGLWLFAFSIWYLFACLDLVGIMPYIVYIAYTAMACVIMALYCGSIAFMGCFAFNRIIYNSAFFDQSQNKQIFEP
jgi:transmembrane 9 superfamily protein 2/4